mmetsp:Transcript_53800/g.135234  ORF Transcript_53800/g.135234 Transcript_53800/m.135234 type:complete len:264 (+) Transcript_53800:1009-1800(+)
MIVWLRWRRSARRRPKRPAARGWASCPAGTFSPTTRLCLWMTTTRRMPTNTMPTRSTGTSNLQRTSGYSGKGRTSCGLSVRWRPRMAMTQTMAGRERTMTETRTSSRTATTMAMRARVSMSMGITSTRTTTCPSHPAPARPTHQTTSRPPPAPHRHPPTTNSRRTAMSLRRGWPTGWPSAKKNSSLKTMYRMTWMRWTTDVCLCVCLLLAKTPPSPPGPPSLPTCCPVCVCASIRRVGGAVWLSVYFCARPVSSRGVNTTPTH